MKKKPAKKITATVSDPPPPRRVSDDVSDDVVAWLSERLPGSRKVGSVTDSGKVTHADSGVFFDHY